MSRVGWGGGSWLEATGLDMSLRAVEALRDRLQRRSKSAVGREGKGWVLWWREVRDGA